MYVTDGPRQYIIGLFTLKVHFLTTQRYANPQLCLLTVVSYPASS